MGKAKKEVLMSAPGVELCEDVIKAPVTSLPLDARTLDEEIGFLAQLERLAESKVEEYQALSVALITADSEERERIEARRVFLDISHDHILLTDIPNVKARIAVLRLHEKEAELDGMEHGIEKLRGELETAKAAVQGQRGREVEVSRFRVTQIESEIATKVATLKREAAKLPWWASVKRRNVEASLLESEAVLSRKLADAKERLSEVEDDRHHQERDQLGYEIRQLERNLELNARELEKARTAAAKRPLPSDPSTWPSDILNGLTAISGAYHDARKPFTHPQELRAAQ